MNDFLPFRPAWRLDPSRIRACTKKTRFFCAQVTGEQPAFQGVNSVPLTMSQRHDRMAVFLTLSVKNT
ncbi:TPA: hypothetical protein IVA66_01615 [Escherichia coli]|nr:hypothetical protein [Escherichia coli]